MIVCLFETDDQNEYKVSEGVNCKLLMILI